MIFIMVKNKRHFIFRACKHLGITLFTGKMVKSPKESGDFDHIVDRGHNASFDNFETLVKEWMNLDFPSESHF